MNKKNNIGTNSNIKTDVAVLGGGPAGYVAAIRLAQLGKSVVLIDKDKLGGICLNYGCIPSKAMIYASEFFHKLKKCSKMGINVKEATMDFNKMQEWKNDVITKLNNGIQMLCKQNGVTVVKGTASFEASSKLKVIDNDNNSKNISYISFENAVIATGSKPIELKNFKFDGKKIISSTEALCLEKIPKNLVVIGGGYIGLELGTVYAKLGSNVAIIEAESQILPGFDKNIANILQKNLENLDIKLYVNAKADRIENNKVVVTSKKNGAVMLDADKILVAVGRVPNTKEFGLENAKVTLDDKGFIKVDSFLRTNDKNIYAIGDVSIGPMLAHKASMQGKFVAEIIAGKNINYGNIVVPAVIFTDPEIAVVGMSEEEAKSSFSIKTGKFPFSVSSRAMTKDETEGFVKIIANASNNVIVGVEIIGNDASDLISEAALAIKMQTTLDSLALTMHPHPTLSESLMEAAEAAMGKSIHIFHPK
ncbi:dihydrolipoyl dehydrogenase [Candidatus Woesearchaeota archaeon]|nr:dihydrolipoyl dehydrogenase [Candidatus Woesearchaeota archaeon]